MAIWLQHLLVLTIVLASAGFIGWQSVQSLRGKKSRVGSCCAKGCSGQFEAQQQAGKAKTERIVFLPVEMLARKKR